MDEALRAAQRAAESSPADAPARLAYGRALLHAGFRAAAAHELGAAAWLGAAPVPDLAALGLEKPAGVRWVLASAREPSEVAAPVADARCPGALARSGECALPLVLVLGGECGRCDDEAMVCADCHGTGLCPDSLDNYHYDPWGLAPCPHEGGVCQCLECRGTKFLVSTRGEPCGHCAYDEDPAGRSLSRCRVCGLAAILGERAAHACPRCALLDCGCERARADR